MSSIKNVNNNSSVVNVGRTTPVTPGQQPSSKSIPVVVASDQEAIPVIEQQKQVSEVALSLLGIPRSEVALGIFADVNTYDVNPSEWSSTPETYTSGNGVKHLPNEAGALVETPRNSTTILSSKRFFRYQPGRVSAATFGVKTSVSVSAYAKNPVIRKFGIFDNFDGYYWETRQSGEDDNFSVVRRTQSLLQAPTSTFAAAGETFRGPQGNTIPSISVNQVDDYRIVGKSPNSEIAPSVLFVKDRQIISENRFDLIDTVLTETANTYSTTGLQTTAGGENWTATGDFYDDLALAINAEAGSAITNAAEVEEKCRRDLDYWLDFILMDLEYGGVNHTKIQTTNYETALLPNPLLFEQLLYTQLKAEFANIAGLSAEAITKTQLLCDIPIAAFATSPVTIPTISDSDYGSKTKLDTIFDVKKYYWATLVTSKTEAGNTVVYEVSNTSPFTTEDIRQKCQRDIIFVLDGYKNDLIGGGNAETIMNASMFYRGESTLTSPSGLSVYTQLEPDGITPTEVERHTHLKNLITADLSNTFSYTSETITPFQTLADTIIENFNIETTETSTTGERGFQGNLVVYRDGLAMVHAGVYDPNLLRDDAPVKAVLSANNVVNLTSGIVEFRQVVKYIGTANGDLENGTLYRVSKVYGARGRDFDLIDMEDNPVTFSAGDCYFQLVNPFIFPGDYDPAVYRVEKGYDIEGSDDPFPQGMAFPYMYAADENLQNPTSEKVGFFNTTTNPSLSGGTNSIRSELDDVNFKPEYVNWIRRNVKPEYYGVYEYRVPRTRFSHDKLDGKKSSGTGTSAPSKVLYSDLASGAEGVIRPGTLYTEDGAVVNSDSVYDFDFTKVTMLKIEFSWYGAVGALFLAYVPVGNGEARWVRVHHLRASNQLKVASLGNATLPITYNVFGGGDSKTVGDGEETNGTAQTTGVDQGYGSDSHNIVKYGASYYIDGGDRGTVRLYTFNNDIAEEAYGKRWNVNSAAYDSNTNSIEISDTTLESGTDIDPVFFIKSKLKTGNKADSNIRVIWADTDRVYLSSVPQDTSTISLISDRANSVYGLETKRLIFSTKEGNAVRNRVQVYPTKLSTSNLGNNPLRLQMKKTPVFQTNVVPSGSISLDADYTIVSSGISLNDSVGVTETSAPFLANGEGIYGFFKASISNDDITVFGKLYKEADLYYFNLLESYNGIVVLKGNEPFLPDKRFTATGNLVTGISKFTQEKEGLSSVVIASNSQVPVPGTGTTIGTVYLKQGTEQIDLNNLFDYNKEYLSYPLTDIADTLYFMVDSDELATTNDLVSIGVTWEEQ